MRSVPDLKVRSLLNSCRERYRAPCVMCRYSDATSVVAEHWLAVGYKQKSLKSQPWLMGRMNLISQKRTF